MSHYDTLGVAADASEADIKQAWRRKSSAAHPDREGGSDALQAAVNKAYEVLGDAERRKNYDECGADELMEPIDVKAREALLVVFMTIVQGATEAMDLVELTEKALIGHRGDHQQEISKANAELRKLRIRARKVRRKTDGENFLVAAMEQRIAQVVETQNRNIEQCQIIDRALELLQEYEYVGRVSTTTNPVNQPVTIGSIAFQWPQGS